MFSDIENLKLISVSAGTSAPGKRTYTRKRNAFIYRASGTVLYKFSDTSITHNAGELIFIPEGITYDIEKPCENSYVSINFDAPLTDLKPALYQIGDFPETDYIFRHLSDLWNFGTSAEKLKCYSLFYNLLSYISSTENYEYTAKKKFEIISPAVKYLKEHIFDCNLKYNTLYTLCGISNTYFRKIFAAKFGTTPQQYIINRRISQAKHLIESGDFLTISEVAAAVGYSDPLYFSRTFKKKYGVSPSKI